MKEIRDPDIFLDYFDSFDLKEQNLIINLHPHDLSRKALVHNNPNVRIAALRAIAKKRPAQDEPLEVALNLVTKDPDPSVRAEAVKTMANYNIHEGINKILREAMEDEDDEVSLAARRAFAFMKV